MEEIHVKEIQLENSLRINIYDSSRRLAGDRWLVAMTARIKIPVDEHLAREAGGPPAEAVKQLLGEVPVFEQRKTRHFIDEREKDAAFQDLLDNFLSYALSYLSHPEFAKRYLLKEFKEKQKQKAWQARPS